MKGELIASVTVEPTKVIISEDVPEWADGVTAVLEGSGRKVLLFRKPLGLKRGNWLQRLGSFLWGDK